MGAIGGGIWHGLKGWHHAPNGLRLSNSLAIAKSRAPVTGGAFAAFGGMLSASHCAVKGFRDGNEDAWNSVIAGFITGGCLNARAGPRMALASASFCGIAMMAFEGVGVLMNRASAPHPFGTAALMTDSAV